MNNNTTKQIYATTQRSTRNWVSTQSARERSLRKISTQVDKHNANKHTCTKWHKLRTNRSRCQIKHTSVVTLFQIHGCKARDIHDSTLLINKTITTNKKLYTTIMGNVFTTDNEKSWNTNKQTKTETNKQNFSLLQSNTVRFILCQKMTILSH